MRNREMLLWTAGIGTGILLLLKQISGKFHKLVQNQFVRGCDGYGCGAFMASRENGTRDHNGLDILTTPGEKVFSPVTGVLKRYSYPYGVEAGLSGYHIVTDKYLIKLWYLAPNLPEGTMVKAGQTIGFAQSLQGRYPGIPDHLHIEVWDLSKNNVAINPSKLF